MSESDEIASANEESSAAMERCRWAERRAEKAEAELREVRALIGVAAESVNEIANFGIPDQPASSAGDELWWAKKHVARLRGMAEREALRLAAIAEK